MEKVKKNDSSEVVVLSLSLLLFPFEELAAHSLVGALSIGTLDGAFVTRRSVSLAGSQIVSFGAVRS